MGKLWPFKRECKKEDSQLTQVKERLSKVELRVDNLKKRVDVITAAERIVNGR